MISDCSIQYLWNRPAPTIKANQGCSNFKKNQKVDIPFIAPSHGCNTTNKELTVSIDTWIDQLSVHETDTLFQSTSMDHLSIAWMMQQTLPRIWIPVFNGSAMEWLESITKFKDLIHELQFLKNTQRKFAFRKWI